jgi:hypothetical protein
MSTTENTCLNCGARFDSVAKMHECFDCFLIRIGEK